MAARRGRWAGVARSRARRGFASAPGVGARPGGGAGARLQPACRGACGVSRDERREERKRRRGGESPWRRPGTGEEGGACRWDPRASERGKRGGGQLGLDGPILPVVLGFG